MLIVQEMLKGNAIKLLRNPFHQCATIPHSLRTNQILVKIDIFFLLETINIQVKSTDHLSFLFIPNQVNCYTGGPRLARFQLA